jgi:hypothetical protein
MSCEVPDCEACYWMRVMRVEDPASATLLHDSYAERVQRDLVKFFDFYTKGKLRESPRRIPQAPPTPRVTNPSGCAYSVRPSDEFIESLRKTPLTPPTPLEPSPLHPTEIAFRIGRFFEQLQDTNPEIVRMYLLHLSKCQPNHPTQQSSADELLRLLERHARTPGQSVGPSDSQPELPFGNEPSDLGREDD